MTSELSEFAARLRLAISSGEHGFVNAPANQGSDEAVPSKHRGAFNHFALELFALQFSYNVAYQKICQTRGLTPEMVEDWPRIPAVPTTAFKELELSCLAPSERTAVFHSSGTTEQTPSRHFHKNESLSLYETSLWHWFEPNVLANSKFKIQNSKLVILTPPPAQAPHSSLVHMFETIRRKLGGASVPASRFHFIGDIAPDGSWVLDLDAVIVALESAISNRQPAILLGTAFSFVHLLDFLIEHDLRFQLPAGSRVMETGGYKNRSRGMPKEELHSLITERLGVSPENIICEYGMSELSSQAYDKVAGRLGCPQPAGLRRGQDTAPCLPRNFQFPPWARVQVVSPETGREVAEGETGLIRVFDLANVFSVMAVQTEDLGVRRGDGFELIGRAQFTEPRGCSLMMWEGNASSLP